MIAFRVYRLGAIQLSLNSDRDDKVRLRERGVVRRVPDRTSLLGDYSSCK